MDATREANSGHPGGPLSCADFESTVLPIVTEQEPKFPYLGYTSTRLEDSLMLKDVEM